MVILVSWITKLTEFQAAHTHEQNQRHEKVTNSQTVTWKNTRQLARTSEQKQSMFVSSEAMANLRLLYSGLGLIICSCKEEERSLRGAVLAGEAVWRASSGAWLSNCAFWPSLLLTGCELETYFGHWHANELTKCPSSLSASISHMGEHWKLRKNFRGTYICKDLYTCVCLPTHT